MDLCPHCRATVTRSAPLGGGWISTTFECGTFQYATSEGVVLHVWPSIECRKATNTPNEPGRIGEQPMFFNRKRYHFNRMFDDEGREVS